MKKLILTLIAALAVSTPAWAQVTVPNIFVGGTTILASEVNANFAKLDDALNRTGGTMNGHILFGSDNTHDIGATGATRPRRIYIGTEVVSPLFTGSISGAAGTFSGTVAADALSLSGTGTITGATTINASGAITGDSFVGSGASLTGIPESAISDGSVFPRLSATETISGAWTFSNAGTAITVSTGAVSFQGVGGTTANFSGTVTAGGAGFYGGGANITGIVETAITDGSILARVGGNETISGTWTFSNPVTVGTTVLPNGVGLDTFTFGGDWREYIVGTSYPSGATFDKLVPGSGVWYVNAFALPGTYALEGICKSDTGGGTVAIAVFDLDGGTPDTALTGSEVTTSATTTGTRIRSSAITFPNAVRTLGVKQKISAASASCWSLRIIRIS